MYQDQLIIPKERIPALIGQKGETKRRLSKSSGCKITVNSSTGEVTIIGEDSLDIFNLKKVIRAIARGFNPKIASMLLSDKYVLEIVNIKDYANDSKGMIRIKSRAIGTKGKSRKTIEALTQTDISIYGKTITIIGEVENALLARRALEMLLKGSKHGNVYGWIERQKKINLHRAE